MENKPLFDRGPAITILIWIILSIVFGLAYTQSHLYNDNQNTKFLHGLAQAGLGLLKEDWLTNTADPLPIFSFLVTVTHSTAGDRLFYVYYLLLMGIYAYSLLGIASVIYQIDRPFVKLLLYFTIILALHSIRMAIFVKKTLGFDLELLHFGLAGQYLLGLDFQNSSFGVFILLSIFSFLKRKPVWAIIWLSLASLFHSAYLFSAAFLTAAYLFIIFTEKLDFKEFSWQSTIGAAREPFFLGLLALIPVLPLVWYNQSVLSSTAPEMASKALDILVNQRIPHHALYQVWFNGSAVLQIALMIVGLFLVKRTRLLLVMLVPFLGGVIFSTVQILTSNNSLALMAPWRVSVFLVPLSTSLIVAYLVSLIFKKLGTWIVKLQLGVAIISLIVIVALVRGGVSIQRTRNNRYYKQETVPVMNFVKQNKAHGQTYLIPTRDNKFDEFRLYTGAPVFINWKSHPYRDFEILEWYRRNQMAKSFYNAEGAEACQILLGIENEYRITHVVFDLDRPIPDCPDLQEIYRDRNYVTYTLAEPGTNE